MKSDKGKISLFLDSGAHSLYTKKVINLQHQDGYGFYKTKEFWDYVDEYAEFVKSNLDIIDVYVNVDVIFNPDMSWKVFQHLREKHDLDPLPVVHFGSDMKWLDRYMNECEYIGIGGLGQEATIKKYVPWADKVFDIICDKDGYPTKKTHGFAMTALRLMFRYPWYSVDSTSWVMTSRMGCIYVPMKRNNQWIYDELTIKVSMSNRSPCQEEASGGHFNNFPPSIQKKIMEYIDYRGSKMGKSSFEWRAKKSTLNRENERWTGDVDEDGLQEVEIMEERGLTNDYHFRDKMNIQYFLDLQAAIPEWSKARFVRQGIKSLI